MTSEAGLAAVERDDLANLPREAAGICTSSAGSGCGHCSADTLRHCRTQLHDAADRLMDLMLDHFNREDALMNALPETGLSRAHCIRHREDHIAISMRYNEIIGDMQAGDAAKGSRTLEAVVDTWLHDHARRFDVELASLLRDR